MSHEEQTDLRIRRTHKFLQEAMIELITEKGFEAITVGDIAERAMINRATFYRHYEDKYDLVAKIFEETADYLVEQMKPFHKDSDHMDRDTHQRSGYRSLSMSLSIASSIEQCWEKTGVRGLSPGCASTSSSSYLRMRNGGNNVGPGQQIDPAMPKALPVMQLSHVLIGTIVWWLESEKRYTPRQIATWFCRFAFYGYLSARGYEVPQ